MTRLNSALSAIYGQLPEDWKKTSPVVDHIDLDSDENSIADETTVDENSADETATDESVANEQVASPEFEEDSIAEFSQPTAEDFVGQAMAAGGLTLEQSNTDAETSESSEDSDASSAELPSTRYQSSEHRSAEYQRVHDKDTRLEARQRNLLG